MIYLLSKIIAYLLTALAIGFGMGWFVQFSQAKRLREQLNGVIFETKSRIPQLETAITSRDQKIEHLTLELADKPTDSKKSNQQTTENESKNSVSDKTPSRALEDKNEEQAKFYEEQLQQLRETVAELTTELEIANSIMEQAEQQPAAAPASIDTQSDDFLDEIKDIFEGEDDVVATSVTHEQRHHNEEPAGAIGSSAELEELRTECDELNSARRKLTETIDNQTRELEQAREQHSLQDKSLNVLNQQLELSRLANERIVRELQKYKQAEQSDDAGNQSANA